MDKKVQAREETPAGLRRCQLPNHMEIAYQSRAEVSFFYNDIFEKQIYLRHGVTLADGDCVFDIGANIGFFTLFAHQNYNDIKVYAVEPAPPLFEILRFNTQRHGVNAKLLNCGMSRAAGTATFTFYPNSSGLSSFYADEQEERNVLRAILDNHAQQGVEGIEQVMRYADDLLEERLKSQTYQCRLRTLSDVIREHRVAHIDFLKIDVQKSEHDVLLGINEEDWPKIKQIVIEVHDIDGRLQQVHELLQARGYNIAVEQDNHYQSSNQYNLFARRGDFVGRLLSGAVKEKTINRDSLKQIQDRARRQEEALNRKKQLFEQRKQNK